MVRTSAHANSLEFGEGEDFAACLTQSSIALQYVRVLNLGTNTRNSVRKHTPRLRPAAMLR